MKNVAEKKWSYISLSVALSTLVHGLLILLILSLPVFPVELSVPERPNRVLTFVRPKKGKTESPGEKGVTPTNTPDRGVSTSPLPPLSGDSAAKIPSPSDNPAGEFELPGTVDVPGPASIPDPTEIVAIDGDSLPKNRTEFNRLMIPKIPRTPGVASSPFASGGGGGGQGVRGMRITLPPRKSGGDNLPTTPETTLIPGGGTLKMDPLLNIKMYKYPDPFAGGFFRIDISPNNKAAAALHPFKKDVVFLLDVSGSIGRARLAQFKSGVFSTVKKLNRGDRFNVVAFKTGNIPFSKTPVAPDPKVVSALDDFLFKLRDEGDTNLYSALASYVGEKNRVGMRPLIVFLISDGRVNYGEMTRDRDILNAISNSNHNGASVYCFSAGEDRNSFLMDLLAYRNRGESRNFNDGRHCSKNLAAFIDQVADVRVSDVDYQISSDLAAATFPKRLPNIYGGQTLSIYGRYRDENRSVGLRVTGRDSAGVEREVVFGAKIADAARGGPEIKRDWARQYIYHLYSLLSVKYDLGLVKKVHEVASEYGVKLPYLDEHLKPRRKNYAE